MISGDKKRALLQVFIVLFAFMVVPAAANEPPLVLEGNLLVDGKPAVVGTEVAIVVDGKVIGETTVTTEGIIGDKRSNRLGIPTGYDLVKVYVDGVESQTLDLRNYHSGEAVSFEISATSQPAANTEKPSSQVAGGGGGGFGSGGADTTEIADEITTESSMDTEAESSLPSTQENAESEVADEGYLPVSTSGTNSMILLIGLVLGGVVIGLYGYRSRK
ncbi:hypothetical protein [Methanolobus sp. WCC5]|uniref:hypothetical protein n=1 Tax=Methanolobus sp. WCC5 TaxID=3125785 RepID=UPI00325228C2